MWNEPKAAAGPLVRCNGHARRLSRCRAGVEKPVGWHHSICFPHNRVTKRKTGGLRKANCQLRRGTCQPSSQLPKSMRAVNRQIHFAYWTAKNMYYSMGICCQTGALRNGLHETRPGHQMHSITHEANAKSHAINMQQAGSRSRDSARGRQRSCVPANQHTPCVEDVDDAR